MNFIGNIPAQVWKLSQDIARKESFPVEQPNDCPYIVLLRISPKQLISLTGILKNQSIQLFLTDVYPPSETNYPPSERKDKDKACTLSWQLIQKALKQFLQTSSINT